MFNQGKAGMAGRIAISAAAVLALAVFAGLVPKPALAHCDTLDGPVVSDAREALATGRLAPVVKWLMPEHEAEVQQIFDLALAAAAEGPAARELAELYFFETVVRLHRAGEGAPYTGLEPAGLDLGPAVSGADAALAAGSVDTLVDLVTAEVEEGISRRFTHALALREHADDSDEAGRRYVAAYVDFVHYVEGLYNLAVAAGGHAHEAAAGTDTSHGEHATESQAEHQH